MTAAPWTPMEGPDLEPAHRRGCEGTFGWVDSTGAPRRGFVRVGGWSCPGCVDQRATELTKHLTDLPLPRALWIGFLTTKERRTASRQAQRRGDIGRVTATRYARTAAVLAERDITPTTRRLRPLLTPRAIERFVAELVAGPQVRRLSWSESWRPDAGSAPHHGGVSFGITSPELMDEAIRAAGFHPDLPTRLEPPVIAARIARQIARLRDERDGAGWATHSPSPTTRSTSLWVTEGDSERRLDYDADSWAL